MAVTRTESTTEAIKQMILSGEFPRGARLQAQMLADRLGVSRTPVSEALVKLHKEGLLDYGPHRGYSIKSFDTNHLLGAFDVRLALEGMACRIVTERGLPAPTIALLRENLAQTEQLVYGRRWTASEQEGWRLANIQFHDLLLESADNPYLTEGVVRARQLPPIFDETNKRIDQSEIWPRLDQYFSQQAFRDHARIVEAIEAGQSARAENMMAEHIYTTREATRRVIEALVNKE